VRGKFRVKQRGRQIRRDLYLPSLARIVLVPAGAEERLFKPTADGWIFSAPNPGRSLDVARI